MMIDDDDDDNDNDDDFATEPLPGDCPQSFDPFQISQSLAEEQL